MAGINLKAADEVKEMEMYVFCIKKAGMVF
jgi:hypothetical protein